MSHRVYITAVHPKQSVAPAMGPATSPRPSPTMGVYTHQMQGPPIYAGL